MTQPEALKLLLEAVATGEIGPAAAQEKLKHFTFEPIEDFAKIDHHRRLRTGFPEVIWGPGKRLIKSPRLWRRCASATQ